MQKHCPRIRKTLSVEDELDAPEQLSGGDFVKAFSSISLGGSEVIGTKLVVKGTAEIEALYLVSGAPQSAHFSLPFSRSFSLCRTAAPTPRSLPAT